MAAGPNFAKPTKLWSRLTPLGDSKRDRRGIVHIDGRTKLGRIHKAFKKALIDHFDGEPNIIERALIERAAMLHIKCLLLDRKLAVQGDLNEMETNHYLAWSQCLQRTLMRLRIRDLDELSRTRAETDRIRAQANYARALL